MQKVRLLAVEYKELRHARYNSDGVRKVHHKIFSLLPNLTEIILVLGDIESLISDAE